MMQTLQSQTTISQTLSATLDQIAEQLTDRKGEVVELLGDEQPAKSRFVEMTYSKCAWWEGCYYCCDQAGQWHQVKCFL